VPQLIHMLDSRSARNTARDALVAIGEPALLALQAATETMVLPRRLRAHLPRSISRFGSAQATDILLDRLEREDDGWIRFKVVRSLGYLRQHMAKHARMERVLKVARANLVQTVRLMGLRVSMEADRATHTRLQTSGGDLLVAVLRDKEARSIDRAVRLLGLSQAADVIHNIRQALATRDARLRADSTELLVVSAPHDIGLALSTLLAHQRDQTHLERAAQALGEAVNVRSYEERLTLMLSESSSAVRALAAYHVNELGLSISPSKRPTQLPAHASTLSRDVLSQLEELRGKLDASEGLEPALGRRSP
jgi:hypothetical protein